MKKFLQGNFVFGLAIINVILYLIGVFGLYIHPKYFVGFSFCTLGFPILLVGLLFFFFLFLWINKKKSFIILIVMAVGYKSILNSFALNFSTQTSIKNNIKILSWNVEEFGGLRMKALDTGNSKRGEILKVLQQEKADVVCLTDFSSVSFDSNYYDNINIIMQLCNYKYFQIDEAIKFNFYNSKGFKLFGTIIFSKYPIINSGIKKYNIDTVFNEGINYVDLNIEGKTLRTVVSHFKSLQLNLSGQNVANYHEQNYHDTILSFKTSKPKKLIIYDAIHANQAVLVKQFLDSSSLPTIFCADLNSVPTSFTYNKLAKNRKDVFLEKGFGIGTTYSKLSPTLRIDVMLVSKTIEVLSCKSPKLPFSDHYPIVATLKLP